MPPTLDTLLASLEAAKSRFGRGAATETRVLLDQLSSHNFGDAKSLIRFHETLLFLRAFPQSAALGPRIEKLYLECATLTSRNSHASPPRHAARQPRSR